MTKVYGMDLDILYDDDLFRKNVIAHAGTILLYQMRGKGITPIGEPTVEHKPAHYTKTGTYMPEIVRVECEGTYQ